MWLIVSNATHGNHKSVCNLSNDGIASDKNTINSHQKCNLPLISSRVKKSVSKYSLKLREVCACGRISKRSDVLYDFYIHAYKPQMTIANADRKTFEL